MGSLPARRSITTQASIVSRPPTSPPPRFAWGPFLSPRLRGRRGLMNGFSHFRELEPEMYPRRRGAAGEENDERVVRRVPWGQGLVDHDAIRDDDGLDSTNVCPGR